MILDIDPTLSFSDNEQSISVIKLFDHRVFWLNQFSLKFWYHHWYDLLLVNLVSFILHNLANLIHFMLKYYIESTVLLDNLAKDHNWHFLLKTGWNHSQEFFQLLLFRLCTLCENKELSYFILEFVWQIHLFHGSVCNINLLLELSLLSSTHFSQYSHITKQCCIENSHTDQDWGTEHDFKISSWSHFITTQEKYSIVVIYKVTVSISIILGPNPIYLWVLSSIHKIKRSYPNLLSTAKEVPATTEHVHHKNKHQYQIHHTESL